MMLQDDSQQNGGVIRRMSEGANLLREPLESYGAEEQAKATPRETGRGKRLKPIDRSQCFWGAIDIEK